MARRDDREYREYLREEQRSQTGCPARKAVLFQRRRATSLYSGSYRLVCALSIFQLSSTLRKWNVHCRGSSLGPRLPTLGV